MRVNGQLKRAQLELVATDPLAGIKAQLIYNTASNLAKYWDGSGWRILVDRVYLATVALANPMTTEGDLMYGGTAGAVTRLPAGTADQVLITGATPAWGKIANANVASNAGILVSKLEALTANRALISDGSGHLLPSTVTATELGYLGGASGNIQDQLNVLAGGVSPLTTKGDLFGFTTAAARVPVGANGRVLTANSATASGLEWLPLPSVSPLTTKGDLYTWDTTNQRLAAGANGQLLQADSTQATGLKWADIIQDLAQSTTAASITVPHNTRLFVDSTAAARVITLTTGAAGARNLIADWKKTAIGSKTITVNPPTGQNFTGLAANVGITLNVAGAALSCYYVGSNEWAYMISGVGSSGGSSSGSSGIDYFTNGNFESTNVGSTPAGWTFYTGAGAIPSTSAVATDGAPTLTFQGTASALRDNVSAILSKPATNQQGKGIYRDFTIKDIDKTRNFILNLDYLTATFTTGDFKVYLWDVTNNVQIPLSISDFGLGYGTLRANCYLTTGLTYRLMIHCAVTTTTASTITLDGCTFGPGQASYGPAVGPWTAYTPIVSNNGSKSFTCYGKWRQNGDSLEVEYALIGNSTAAGTGTSTFTMSLPSGCTIDLSKLAYSTAIGASENVIGVCQTFSVETVGQFDRATGVVCSTTTTVAFVKPGSANYYQATHMNNTNAAEFCGNFKVPIVEFGQGTLPLSNASGIEYASNNGSVTTAGGNNPASNTVRTPDGTPIIAVNSTTAASYTSFDVQWLTPIQQGDLFEIQFRSAALDAWFSADGYAPMSQGTSTYGIQFDHINANTTRVYFGNKGSIGSNPTYGGDGSAWSVSTSRRWRVKKTSAAMVAGIQPATANGPGLVQGGQVPGNSGVSAIASSFLGNVQTFTYANQNEAASGVILTLTGGAFPLQPGSYLIIMNAGKVGGTGMQTNGGGYVGLSTDAGATSYSDRVDGLNNVLFEPSSGSIAAGSVCLPVTLSVATNFYVKSRVSYSSGTPSVSATIRVLKL